MNVQDGDVGGGAELEIATGTHVEDGIMESPYDVAVKGDGERVGYMRFTGQVRYNNGLSKVKLLCMTYVRCVVRRRCAFDEPLTCVKLSLEYNMNIFHLVLH